MRSIEDYRKQIDEYLADDKDRRRMMWMRDAWRSKGTRLFSICGIEGCGCPTMVKSGQWDACTPEITAKIRALDIPEGSDVCNTAPVDLTLEQLEAIAGVQLDVWNHYHGKNGDA